MCAWRQNSVHTADMCDVVLCLLTGGDIFHWGDPWPLTHATPIHWAVFETLHLPNIALKTAQKCLWRKSESKTSEKNEHWKQTESRAFDLHPHVWLTTVLVYQKRLIGKGLFSLRNIVWTRHGCVRLKLFLFYWLKHVNATKIQPKRSEMSFTNQLQMFSWKCNQLCVIYKSSNTVNTLNNEI